MSKKRKNANYVTEKNENKKKEAAHAKQVHDTKVKILAIGIPVLVILAVVLTIVFVGAANGWWDEKPVVTQHASITLDNGISLHVELYGENAPETVKQFVKLAEGNKYNGLTFDRVLGGLLETSYVSSSTTINGEFSANGVENIVKHRSGTLSMVLHNGTNSANGEFFIVLENNKDLDGNHAAFGRITGGLDALKEELEKIQLAEDGSVPAAQRIKITGVSVHESH